MKRGPSTEPPAFWTPPGGGLCPTPAHRPHDVPSCPPLGGAAPGGRWGRLGGQGLCPAQQPGCTPSPAGCGLGRADGEGAKWPLVPHLLPEANGPKPAGVKTTSLPRGGPGVAQDSAPFPAPRTPPPAQCWRRRRHRPQDPVPSAGAPARPRSGGPPLPVGPVTGRPVPAWAPWEQSWGRGAEAAPPQPATHLLPAKSKSSKLFTFPATDRAGRRWLPDRGLLVIKAGWPPPGPCPTSLEAQCPALPGLGLSLVPGDTPGPHASAATPCSAP